MNYSGHAFNAKAEDEGKKISERFNEIDHLRKEIEISTTPAYAHTTFRGKLLTDAAKELSEMDILIFADHGNLCFGGDCRKNSDGTFSGSFNTD